MQAMVIHEYGNPDVMKFEQYPDPALGPGQILVKVAAASINPFDLMRRSGVAKEVAPIAFPGIVGVDVSGTVAEIGTDVHEFSVGDRVFGIADRTYAELCVVKADDLAKIPDGLDLIDAAALPLVTITGNELITQGTEVKSGQTVFISGAVGNVGRSAVYTAKSLGAFVIAGVLKKQLEAASSLGADRVIATDDEDALSALPHLDAVADTVGGATATAVLAKIKDGGVFASVVGIPPNGSECPNIKKVAVYTQGNKQILLFMA